MLSATDFVLINEIQIKEERNGEGGSIKKTAKTTKNPAPTQGMLPCDHKILGLENVNLG